MEILTYLVVSVMPEAKPALDKLLKDFGDDGLEAFIRETADTGNDDPPRIPDENLTWHFDRELLASLIVNPELLTKKVY